MLPAANATSCLPIVFTGLGFGLSPNPRLLSQTRYVHLTLGVPLLHKLLCQGADALHKHVQL